MGHWPEFQRGPGQQHTLGADWRESDFAEKDLGVLVDNTWNVSQWCVLVVKKNNSILSCTNKNIVSRFREVPSI